MTVRPLDVIRIVEGNSSRLPEAAKEFPETVPSFSAILEDIRSLWNVGSIYRTADGAGIDHLFLCGITGVPPRSQIAKTSLGAEEVVPWTYSQSALDSISYLKERGVFVVALEFCKGMESIPDSISLGFAIAQNLVRKPLCIIVGNEVSGVSAEVLSMSDLICHLPMRGLKESLNVSVAFGIAAYALST